MLQYFDLVPPILPLNLFLLGHQLLLLFGYLLRLLLLIPKGDQIRTDIVLWLPRALPSGVALPLDAILHHAIDLSLSQDIFHLVCLPHSNLIYNKQITMLNQTPQFDDCFEVELPIKKINQVIFMSSSQLLILHSPNQYTFVQILNRNQVATIKTGKLPNLAQNVRRISDECVSFICQNQLHVFNLLQERSLHIYSIARSAIYSEQFHYQTYGNHDNIFLFYKTSILKGTPINIYYEIHQLVLKEGFQKVKRIKCQHQQIRKFGYSCGQIFSCQLSGYQIEVIFLQSGITHKIQSIFNLFLIEIKSCPDEILLNFTHDEMENEFSTYKVTKKKVTKMNRTSKNPQKHTVYNENRLRSIVFKNCYNHRRQDPYVGIFRVRICKQTKLLHLMQNGLEEEISSQFKQLILSFNKQ